MTTLRFCGAAGTVTGSCSLIDNGNEKFLIDCGLFQGNRTTQELNYQPFVFDASEIKFLLVTHAHIDHTGLVPKLIKAGFTGPIYATTPTVDLMDFMLRDSAFIQESNAERQNRKLERRGEPLVEPVYTIKDAEEALKRLRAHDYEEWFEPTPGVKVRFWNAGHLLGSASAEIQMADKEKDRPLRLLFSGDLGPDEKAFHPQPDAPEGYDYIICESTYGGREREDYTLKHRRDALKHELVDALARGGNVVIPSFAVERSQELLHDIGTLLAEGLLPGAAVYLDSPLARKATEVFVKHANTLQDVELEPEKLFRHERFHLVESVQESKAVNQVRKGAIIISASGMCTAGRIKHHLKNNIYRRESTILFVGYQSPGTLGHIITSGAKSVRIHGKEYKVQASIRRIGNYSAHADQSELIDWVLERGPIVGGLFLNHGEDEPRKKMRALLGEKGLDVDRIFAPDFDESFELIAGDKPLSKGIVAPRVDVEQFERDWHNDYAAFILELSQQLHAADGAHGRQELIRSLSNRLSEISTETGS